MTLLILCNVGVIFYLFLALSFLSSIYFSLSLQFPQVKTDFPGGSDSTVSAYNVGDPGSIPGLGRSPGEGNGNPLQYSCLENPMDREAWWATVHGVAKSRTRLSYFTSISLQVKTSSLILFLLGYKGFTMLHQFQTCSSESPLFLFFAGEGGGTFLYRPLWSIDQSFLWYKVGP